VADTVDQLQPGKARIGRQITLPFSKAFEIAWKSIKIRIWRSLITMSGVVLAIAFLMSVWTGGVFIRTMRGVSPTHEMYPAVRRVLEAEAIASGSVRIRCNVVGAGDVLVDGSSIGVAEVLQKALDAHRAVHAQLVPRGAESVEGADIVVTVGLPAPELAEAVLNYVKAGGVLIVYGTEGVARPEGEEEHPLLEIMPGRPSGADAVEVRGEDIIPSKDSPVVGILWRNFPTAAVLPAESADGKPLAEAGGVAVGWWRVVGEGAVAWYPVDGASGADPDVLSWFARGRLIGTPGEEREAESLLVRMATYGAGAGLGGAQHDTRGTWLVGLSLLVCVVGITNAMLMSVTERYREIGTMKCLGALDTFVVRLFLIESSLQGVVGSLCGALIGFGLAFVRALFTFHIKDLQTGQSYWLAVTFFPGTQLLGWLAIALGTGIVLSIVAAIYPAMRAAKMEPVQAMRVEA